MLYEGFLPVAMTFDNNFSYYGEIFKTSSIEEDTKDVLKFNPTIACCITKSGFHIIYNKNFIDSMNETERTFAVIHEECHFTTNTQGRGMSLNKEVVNMAADMVINYNITKHIPVKFATMPEEDVILDEKGHAIPEEMLKDYKGKTTKERIVKCQVLPKEYVGDIVMEDVYYWLLNTDPKTGEDKNNRSKLNTNGQKMSEGVGNNGANGENTIGTKQILEHCQAVEDWSDLIKKLDEHIDDEVSKEIKEVMIKEIIDRCKLRGTLSSNEEEMLKGLRKSKKDYLREIKRSVSNICGTEKKTTWARKNRKGLPFPGFKRVSTVMNIILDTSGSMSGCFDKTLSYVFYNGYIFNLYQNDTEVKATERIKDKKQFVRLKIKGLGGTCLQPAIDMISKNQEHKKLPTIILTDGETDSLDVSKISSVLIISSVKECPITKKGTKKLKQIVIVNEDK